MAPTTFHLLTVKDADAFITALGSLPRTNRPLYVGRCHHWIHEPRDLSTAALLGTKWEYHIIHHTSSPDSLALPPGMEEHVTAKWSIAGETPESILETYHSTHEARLSAPVTPLPSGWSAEDHSGLDASIPPPDLEASLALKSYPLGSNRDTDKRIVLKDFIRSFGVLHKGPVQMLNLLSCLPGQRPRIYAYFQAFGESVGKKYDGAAMIPQFGVTDWMTRKEEGELTIAEAKNYGTEEGEKVGWEDAALVWYPSLWHFAKLLDDSAYAEADRKFKQGVLRDNPILMCSEVYIEYET